MSAIAGIIIFDGQDPAADSMRRLGRALAHRSPHGFRDVNCGQASLGFGLMQLCREDRYERQPLRAPNSPLTMVADCRLDNREELAAALDFDVERLAETPDSALLLAAFLRWGEGCTEHLLGEFAFAVWDAAAGRLTLVRDHMGQRYLHYYRDQGIFAFATEAKALLSLPQIVPEIESGQLGLHILREPDRQTSATLFKGITGLEAATVLSVTATGETLRRYWEPRAAPHHLGRDEAYYRAQYRKLLEEAVACRVRRLIDPPGLLLSGGMDSASIAALTAAALPQGRRLVTISSVPAQDDRHPRSARPWVEVCIRHMRHLDHLWHTNSGETPLDGFERRAHALDRPPMLLNQLTCAMLARLRGRGVRLVMDGIGGDATVNPRGTRALADLLRAGRIGRLIGEIRWERRRTQRPLPHILWHDVIRPSLPRALLRQWIKYRAEHSRPVHPYAAPSLIASLLADGHLPMHDPLSLFDQMSERERRMQALALFIKRAQPNLANEAASQGLVLSRPMLDKRLVEFGLAVPDALTVVRGRNRHLARCALQDVLPPEFQTRPAIQEYYEPRINVHLRAALPQMREDVARMSRNEHLRQYFDLDRMKADLEKPPEEVFPENKPSYLFHAYLSARYVSWFRRDNA